MILGYNTNGFAHHRLGDAVAVLAELGYGGVALTPDVHHLDPFAADFDRAAAGFADAHARSGLRWVVETGARFVLDPRRKHQPTLLSASQSDVDRRVDYLRRCVVLGERLNADAVSLWSGAADADRSRDTLMGQLADELARLADFAADRGQRLAFEPEPGMFIATMADYAELYDRVRHPAFGLTVDVGHLVCTGELPVSAHLARWKDVLWNVHTEDMKAGVHDHVMFGTGDVDFADVFAGLRTAGYAGGVYVELSRHSHDAVATARNAKAFLDPYFAADGDVAGTLVL